jgi:hypothetical protein
MSMGRVTARTGHRIFVSGVDLSPHDLTSIPGMNEGE